jgi:uncharacterized membrane protein
VPEQNSKAATIAGLAVAGAGVAHFIKPELFESITKGPFPDDTAKAIKINGSLETAIGLGLAVPQTRKLALVGLVGYGAYLAVNVARNR